MKIYVASFFDTRARLAEPVTHLREMGHEVTSRWLQELPSAAYNTASEAYLLGCAVVDLTDIDSSDAFILDTIDETPRGGREVEYGLALSLKLPTFVVGPYRNVFHRLATAHYASWGEALSFFAQVRR